MNWLFGYLRDEGGNSASEYALILGVIGLGVLTAAFALSDQIAAGMERAGSNIKATQQ
jgi:pilus assembly protein Flp/PilA